RPPGSILPPNEPVYSILDRESLDVIATAGGGQYFELGRDSDRDIANRIISATRRRAGSMGMETSSRELYWQCLFAAACLLVLGVVFMQERVELWIYTAGVSAAMLLVWSVMR